MTREPDIVERLRKLRGDYAGAMVIQEAVAEIERLTEEELSHARTVKDNWQADAALRAEIERLIEAHERIVEWSRAYPLTIFPKPDLKKARELLEAGGMTLDAISADAMRHVIEGVGKISRAALEPKP